MSWIIFALLSAISAAGVAILGKIGVQGIDTTLATTIRAIIMAVFLSLVALFLGKSNLLPTLHMKPIIFIALSGLAGALSWFFYFFALKNGPASAVAALDRLSVVFVLVLAVLFLGESFNWKSSIGAIFIVLGAILMVLR